MKHRDNMFWIRSILWLISIVIVGWPLSAFRKDLGDVLYILLSFFVLGAFFALGLWLTSKYGQDSKPDE